MSELRLPFLCIEASALLVAYLVPTRKLQAVTPAGLDVLEVFPGRSPVGIACIDYRQTSVGAYGEVGISWPVVKQGAWASRVPLFPLLAGARWPGQGWWVHTLPVTTEAARDAGVRHWGYPKFLANIHFGWEGAQRSCHLASQSGEDILRVSVDTRMPARPQRFAQRTFSRMDGQLRGTLVHFEGTGLGRILSAHSELTLGAHPLGRQLEEWGLGTASAVNVQWFPVWRAVLPGPEEAGD